MSKTKGCGLAKVINPDDLEAMAIAGFSQAMMSRYYGITRQQLSNIIRDNPQLQDAISNGLENVYIKCVNTIMTKVNEGNLLAAMYMLNNRFGWMEEKYKKEKPAIDVPSVQIFLPENNRNKEEEVINV